MEGQSHQKALQLTSLAFDGNTSEVSHLAENPPCQNYLWEAGRNEIHYVPPPLPQWIHSQQTAHNYVEFLTENGASEIQGEISYNNSDMVSSFRPIASPCNMDAQKVKYLRPHNGAPMNNCTSADLTMCLKKQESYEGARRGFSPKPRNNVSRQRATAADRRRKLRIAERLNALQELLPYSKQGNKASQIDDIIDHIKYLQLQIKDLSRNRLGGESTSNPFIFLEGYGHYLIHEQMLNEPLEEIMGKLLEVNQSAANQLLASRGLFMMPMALAERLHQAT